MPSRSGSVRVLSPSAIRSSLEGIVAAHRGQGGGNVTLTFETAPRLVQRIADGEAVDIIIAPPTALDELIGLGKVSANGRIELGRVGVGVVVRAGTPPPDVSSTEALKRSLLAADSVLHTRASSGIYVAKLLERLGIATAIKAKTASFPDAQETFTHLLNGTSRDIGFGGITEIKRWHDKGLRLVAPLPADIQNYTTYCAALAKGPPNRDGAQKFLKFLGSPAARAILLANGVDRLCPA
jgi:molybdate transport system substrate-binding protein